MQCAGASTLAMGCMPPQLLHSRRQHSLAASIWVVYAPECVLQTSNEGLWEEKECGAAGAARQHRAWRTCFAALLLAPLQHVARSLAIIFCCA